MCNLKSAIILKDRIFMPDYDSHIDMLNELGIEDNRKNAEQIFVRAELSPKNGDVSSPIDEWIFKVDQDIQPDWYVENFEKERMIQAVKEWAKDHIHIGIDGLEINKGENHYIKDCDLVKIRNSTVTALGNSTVMAYNNSTVTALGNSAVTAYNNSTVMAWNNSTVKAFGNSTVMAYNNSTVKAFGNSTIIKLNYSSFKKGHLVLYQNAIFKDCKEKVIYQCGGWKLRSVNEMVGED